MCESRSNKFRLAERFHGSEESIWTHIEVMNKKFNPVDLSGGYANFSPEPLVTQSLEAVAKSSDWHMHQYANSQGHERLLKVLCDIYSPSLERKLDPNSEVLITYGAQEALNCTIMSLINPGDEVILIDPAFDCYVPLVNSAGGCIKTVRLKLKCNKNPTSSADFVLDTGDLENAFNDKTKMIILNTPQNPIGKLYSKEECTAIADLCKKFNVICVSDNVYEWIVYKPNCMFKIATLPGMWERTITIGSAGKTFHITGWKTGWAFGPPHLIKHLKVVHQHTVFACVTPIQEALAVCFEKELKAMGTPCSMINKSLEDLQKKRDFVVEGLKEIGFKPVVPEAGYFILADWSDLSTFVQLPNDLDKGKDYHFAMWLIENVNVSSIPPSVFCAKENVHIMENYLRFSFIKDMDTLTTGIDLLRKLKAGTRQKCNAMNVS